MMSGKRWGYVVQFFCLLVILGQEDGAGACCCIDFGIRRNRGAYNKVTFWNWGLSV